MSSGNLEVTDDLSKGGFSGEVAAETRSHGGEEEVDPESSLIYHILPHSGADHDVLVDQWAGQAVKAGRY